MNRRHFLATGVSVAGVGVGGCLTAGGNENGGDNESERKSTKDIESDDGTGTESCEIKSRERRGNAEPIERTAIKDDSGCGIQAASEVIGHLDERLNVELESASWISPAYSITDEQAIVSVYARGSDGEITMCPDPDWDFDDALEVLPSEITLILTDEPGEKQGECSHEVFLEQGTRWVD